jgi:hypothetical protein
VALLYWATASKFWAGDGFGRNSTDRRVPLGRGPMPRPRKRSRCPSVSNCRLNNARPLPRPPSPLEIRALSRTHRHGLFSNYSSQRIRRTSYELKGAKRVITECCGCPTCERCVGWPFSGNRHSGLLVPMVDVGLPATFLWLICRGPKASTGTRTRPHGPEPCPGVTLAAESARQRVPVTGGNVPCRC